MSHARGWKVGVAILFASSCGLAQGTAAEQHRLLPVSFHPAFAAAGDLDGDGDQDLIGSGGWATVAAPIRLQNDGAGRFTAVGPALSVYPAPIALGDIDGDGDLDVAIGGGYFGWPIPGMLLRNDGPLGFTDVSSQWPTTMEWPGKILLVDFEGDGDLDIVTCNRPSLSSGGLPFAFNRVYLNNGAGVFADATAQSLPNGFHTGASVAAGDIDNDGDADLIFCGAPLSIAGPQDSIRVFVQSSPGVAQQVVAFAVPPTDGFVDIALIDCDLDGDLDIVAAALAGVFVFANNGAGQFTLSSILPDGDVRYLVPADIDGDGRVDLVAVRRTGYTQDPLPMRLYRNTTGGFVDVTATQVENPDLSPRFVVAFDSDGDGDVDLWGDAQPQSLLWHNDGQGRLLQLATHDLCNRRIWYATAADADLDGDLDVAWFEIGASGARRVLFADNVGPGPGNSLQLVLPLDAVRPAQCLVFVDCDLDGDQDLFVGRIDAGAPTTGQDMLFENIAGTFVDVTAAHMPISGGATDVITGDVDGDGVTDLVTAGGVSNLYRGDGIGGFTLASAVLPATPKPIAGVALLDFDQDGDLDLVRALGVPTTGGPFGFRLLRNDWPATFVDVTAALGLSALQARAVATIDIDRDGRLDLLVADDAPGTNGLLVLRAVGAGFVDETALRVPVMSATTQFSVIDLDGDGWDDVISDNPSIPLLVNTNGVLAPWPSPWFVVAGWPAVHTVAADFDHDGDQDLIGVTGLLRNRTRQLQSNVPPRLGQNAEIALQANAGDGVHDQAAVLLLAPQLAAAPIATSFGTLFLDPATAVYHSTHLIPGTGGEAVVPYSVPSSPSVLGSVWHAQAVFVHRPDAATWRLGNVLELRVRL